MSSHSHRREIVDIECKRASNTRSSSPRRHKEINKEDDAFNCYLVVGWNGEFNKPKKEEVYVDDIDI